MERIDVHHHILPPDYAAAWKNGPGLPAGLMLPEWSPTASLDFMNRNSIGAAILSLSAPGLAFASLRDGIALCRQVNEYAADLRHKHPTRFGFFATLPLGFDIAASLEEIAYAYDVLNADGVTLLTSYNKLYLGHSSFRPIWDELERRSAVVFIHPTFAGGVSDPPALIDPLLPGPYIDFPHETTRTAVHIILSNTVRRCPNVKIILSHGGGTLPYTATRVSHTSFESKLSSKTPTEFLEDARSMYYDLALTAYDYPLDLLQNFAKPSNILYGSDFPFARELTIKPQIDTLKLMAERDGVVGQEIARLNALKLFPRFAEETGELSSTKLASTNCAARSN